MKLRLDLLEENERRHVGPVSPKFIVFSAAALIGGLGILGAVVLGWNWKSLESQLRIAQHRWEQLAPSRNAQETLKTWTGAAKRLQDEVAGWGKGRQACGALGERIARLADADWQASSLSYRDTLATRARPGGDEMNPVLYRRFVLTLTGRIRSEQANVRSAKLAQDLGAPLDGRELFANPPTSQLSQQSEYSQFEIRGLGQERVIP